MEPRAGAAMAGPGVAIVIIVAVVVIVIVKVSIGSIFVLGATPEQLAEEPGVPFLDSRGRIWIRVAISRDVGLEQRRRAEQQGEGDHDMTEDVALFHSDAGVASGVRVQRFTNVDA